MRVQFEAEIEAEMSKLDETRRNQRDVDQERSLTVAKLLQITREHDKVESEVTASQAGRAEGGGLTVVY